MVAAYGNTDPTSYKRISSLNRMEGFNTISGSPQFQNASFSSFQPNVMLGRLNSSASLGIQRLPSPVQVNHSQFSGFTGLASEQGTTTVIPGNQSGRILKGMPMPVSFEFDQLQDNNHRSVSDVGEVNPRVNELAGFPVSSGLPYAKGSVRSLSTSHLTASNNSMMLQGHSVRACSQHGIQSQLSAGLPTLSPDLSSHFSDRARGNDHWPIAVQSSAVQTNSYGPYHGSQHMNTHLDNGSSSIGEMPLSVADYQYQAAHPSIEAGHASYGQDIISIPRITNRDETADFNSIEHPAYVDRQADHLAKSISMPNSKRGYLLGHGKSQVYQLPNTVDSLEDLVSSMMK